MNENLRNAVYGAVIGDALGVPYEFKKRGTFTCSGMIGYGTHHQPAGTWSDDSSMILATCKSLKEKDGKIVIDDIKEKFRQWYYDGAFTATGKVFDVGISSRIAITTGKGQAGERSNGNGSLMRILPLAFVDCTDEEIRAVSAITHAHWVSMEACVIYVHLIREGLKVHNEINAKRLGEIVRDLDLAEPFDRLCRIADLDESAIKSSGYVVDTLEAAIWCVLTSQTYTECLLKAVNLGDDTDTVACVAGGLGVCKFAFDEILDQWINEIKNKDLIQECLF